MLRISWKTYLAIGLITLWISACGNNQKPADNVVASVNGTIITDKQLNMALSIAKARYLGGGQDIEQSKRKEFEHTVLENLIGDEVLYQECLKRGVTVSEVDVDKFLEKAWMNYDGKDDFEEVMASIGLTEQEVRERLRQETIIKKFIDEEITSAIQVSDEEVKKHYDENIDQFKLPKRLRARHILIRTNKDDTKEQKQKALEKIIMVQKKLQEGEDFISLAKRYSEGQSSVDGGDVGIFGPGAMVKPFEEAAYKLKPGEVSDIVETQFGFHIIKVEEILPESFIPFEQMVVNIRPFLLQEKKDQAIRNYIANLKKTAKIKVYKS